MIRKYFPVLVAVLGSLALFLNLGYMELRGEEARRALVAMEMIHENSFWVPLLHGLPYINKPPVYQWVLIMVFNLPIPISEFLLRLPGVLSAIATAWVLVKVAGFYTDSKTSWKVGLMYLTSADLLFFGLVYAGEIDPFFALVSFAQIACLLLVFDRKISKNWLLLSFFLCAVGILTKGLPSIAIQALSLGALTVWTRNWKIWTHWSFAVGALLCLGLPTLYFWKYSQTGDAGTYLINLYWESVKKSGAVSTMSDVLVHLFSFPFQFLGLMAPWVFVLWLLVKPNNRKAWINHDFIKTILILLLVNLSIYWLSPDTRNRYLYPFIPLFLLCLIPLVQRVRSKYFWLAVIALFAARLSYNLIGMPLHQKHFEMRDAVSDALQLTGNQAVRYLEDWDTTSYQIRIPFIGQLEGDIPFTKSMHYKVPFYFMKENGHIMYFDTAAQKDVFYITRDTIWNYDESTILYVFPEKSNKHPLWLTKKE